MIPIHDEGAAECEALSQPDPERYDGIREATTVEEVVACLNDPRLEAKGAIRYHGEDGSRVFLYFWARR